MNKIAIYDIDYTIISINSLLAYLIFIIKKKPIKILYLPFFIIVTFFWIVKIISTKKVKELWLTAIHNINEEEINKISKEFINMIIIPKIKSESIININNFKKMGYKIIFASASFELYIKHLADYLNADYCIGTKIKIEDNKLKAKIIGNNCKGKEKIRRILELIPESKIEKKESVGYSDSNSDLPFLMLAETFYKISRKRWKINKTTTN